MRNIFYLLTVLMLTGITTKAQFITNRPIHVQIDGGLNIFNGDLKRYRYAPTTRDNNEITLSGAFKATFAINQTLLISGQYSIGRISGTDKIQDQYFKANTQIVSLNAQIVLNRIFDQNKFSFFNNRFLTYATVGIGNVYYSTRKYVLSTNTLIDSKGYATVFHKDNRKEQALVFPVGLGASFKLTKNENKYNMEWLDHVYINLETVINYLDTDNFDLTTTDQSSKDNFVRFSTGIIYVF